MIRSQINEVLEANKRCRTDHLKKIIKDLSDIHYERELTKSMYFWQPGKEASTRRYHEDIRRLNMTVQIKGLTVRYVRRYSESCRYVYASDDLWSKEYEHFNNADISKLIDGFKEVLRNRK